LKTRTKLREQIEADLNDVPQLFSPRFDDFPVHSAELISGLKTWKLGYWILPDLSFNKVSQQFYVVSVSETSTGINLQTGEGEIVSEADLQYR